MPKQYTFKVQEIRQREKGGVVFESVRLEQQPTDDDPAMISLSVNAPSPSGYRAGQNVRLTLAPLD